MTNIYAIKDNSGKIVHFFAEAQNEPYPAGYVEIDETDTAYIVSQNQSGSSLKIAAINAISKSDIQIVRCYESNIAVPSDWISYRNALREIINGSGTELPTVPAFPS